LVLHHDSGRAHQRRVGFSIIENVTGLPVRLRLGPPR